MELTELIKDYVATELLSSIELDFLEGELWETTQHIAEINTVFIAPKKNMREIRSRWQILLAIMLCSYTWLFKTFKEGDSFVLSANTPAHTMANSGNSSAVMWVAVASAEGIPTLNPEE